MTVETPATRAGPPPGPAGRRFTGVAGEIRRDPLTFLAAAAREHGPVVRLPLFAGGSVLMVTEAPLAEQVLTRRHRAYPKSRFVEKLRPLFGLGIITSDGPVWRRNRQMVQPAFRERRVDALADLMAARAEACAASLAAAGDAAAPVDIGAAMMDLSLDVMTRALGGDEAAGSAAEIVAAVDLLLAEAERRTWSLVDLPLAVPTPRNRAMTRAIATLDRIVLAMIERRRYGDPSAPSDDIVTMLLAARDARTGDAFTDREIVDEVKTLLVAGHETSASAMTSVWVLLSRHPAARRRLEAEVDAAVGDCRPGLADVARLPFTRNVVLEAMRLYPPAWTFSRMATEDDVVGGHPVPAGTVVMLPPWVLHRDPARWPNPEGFDPDRFDEFDLGPAGLPGIAEGYLPFGGGPRRCLGYHFAMLELILATATLARRFRFDLAPGARPVPQPMISLRFGPAVPVTVRRREADTKK